MSETKLILLCGGRMALPVMRDLVFNKQLAAVVIPEHCTEFIMEVQLLLKESGIPVILVNKKDQEVKMQQAIKKQDATMGLMVTYSFKLPATIYKLPEKGFFNIHPGPLPSYRGPDPVFQQIKNGEEYAGITIHKVDGEFDTGPVVISDKIRLAVTDTHGLLTTKLAELAARSLGVLIKMAGFGFEMPTRKQDNEKAVYYKKQSAADITINWETMPAKSIIALIQACNPWNKGAVTLLNNKIIRILEAEIFTMEQDPFPETKPGLILIIDDKGILVSAMHHSRLRVNYIYTEEGFLHASRLAGMGFATGMAFQKI